MTEQRDWFASCKTGHPDDHWRLEPLCQVRTLVADHRNKPEPPVCGVPASHYQHNAPRSDLDPVTHQFVPPTEPLVWGENAWRTNDCPGHVRVDPEFEFGEMVFEGIDESCECQCHWSRYYVNVFALDRQYGGPEEGGWWYDTGEPVASMPFDTLREAEAEREKLAVRFPSTKSRYSMGAYEADYGIQIESTFARPFPETTPRYE